MIIEREESTVKKDSDGIDFVDKAKWNKCFVL